MTDRWGIDDAYVDAGGTARRVDPAVVEQLRGLIGEPSGGGGPVVVRTGEPLGLGRGELRLEDGSWIALGDDEPDEVPLGYHLFVAESGATTDVIVSPGRCHLPPGLRAWGWAVQLYAIRSQRSWGIGDLADLAEVGRWARSQGAGFLLVNPLGAVSPTEPQQASPYFPTSRRFRNPLYLRPELVPGAAGSGVDLQAASTAGRALGARREIDRDAVWRIKSAALEELWRAGVGRREFEDWFEHQPGSLERFATWCALVEAHGPRWDAWPAELRSPGPTAVSAADGDRLRFHAWLQWLAAEQLGSAGRTVGLVSDLPIGFDPHGFDAWEWQDLLAEGVTVGAPPDEFSRDGQDWGLPPFVPWRLRAAGYGPFVDTIRASMASSGGLRIDHVMGLFRLWWIAGGASPRDGAYVRYPADDLLAIVALESHRAGAVVVGEDLGTVEESARDALATHDVLSYRLLWFEDGPPSTWPATSMAAVTTHDLPTVAGLWSGDDLAAQRRAGLDPNEEGTEEMRARLVRAAGLGDGATIDDAVLGAHRALAESPAVLLCATLDDALAEPERPNVPGADGARPNWSLALPATVEELPSIERATRIAQVLGRAVAAGGGEAEAKTDPAPEALEHDRGSRRAGRGSSR